MLSQRTLCFLIKDNIESEEIKPQWFNKNQIPLDKMWDDSKYWLPQILKDKYMNCTFYLSKDLKVEKYEVENS